MRSVGICTSSRSERRLCEALVNEANNGKHDLKAELIEINSMFFTPLRNTSFDILREYDFLIIPADRTEMTRFAYELFTQNIPFCHFLAGSRTYSYTHDDINRWMISLMANFCFAESPRAVENLVQMGIPIDRITLTGTSHFDGVTIQDIEVNKPRKTPKEPYDLVLYNKTTMKEDEIKQEEKPINQIKNEEYILVSPNEDTKIEIEGYNFPRLEFLYLLHHADHFISNSSAGIYELPYIQKYYGSKCKLYNPSQRNKERTPIDPMYCKGASKIIAEWCESVDLGWLRTPKRLFKDKTTAFPSGY